MHGDPRRYRRQPRHSRASRPSAAYRPDPGPSILRTSPRADARRGVKGAAVSPQAPKLKRTSRRHRRRRRVFRQTRRGCLPVGSSQRAAQSCRGAPSQRVLLSVPAARGWGWGRQRQLGQ